MSVDNSSRKWSPRRLVSSASNSFILIYQYIFTKRPIKYISVDYLVNVIIFNMMRHYKVNIQVKDNEIYVSSQSNLKKCQFMILFITNQRMCEKSLCKPQNIAYFHNNGIIYSIIPRGSSMHYSEVQNKMNITSWRSTRISRSIIPKKEFCASGSNPWRVWLRE